MALAGRGWVLNHQFGSRVGKILRSCSFFSLFICCIPKLSYNSKLWGCEGKVVFIN